MLISLMRKRHCILCSTKKRLIHNILIPQLRHLIWIRSIDITAHTFLFSLLSSLCCFNPLLIFLISFTTLSSFPDKVTPLGALFHMILRFINRVKNMFFIIFTINSDGKSPKNLFLLGIIKKHWHTFPMVANIIFMVNQDLLVCEIMRSIELTTVNYFTSSISTTSYVELPFWIHHEFVVGIEWTNKGFYHLVFRI